jgi:putative endonuclease
MYGAAITQIGARISAKPDRATAPNDVAPERRVALGAALLAKTRAPQYLLANGCRSLAKRLRRPHHAFDLVAKRRGTSLNIKACAAPYNAAFAVTPHHKAAIIETARVWYPARPALGDFEPRVEAIAIAPRHWPRHLLAAFVASSSPLTRGRPR